MYNYQEDIKKSLGEISEKLNVEPKNRPAAYNIHEEIANTLHDISEKVSEGGGSGGGPGYEVVPTTETVLFDGEIQAVEINGRYVLPLYTDVDGFPDNWPEDSIRTIVTFNGERYELEMLRYGGYDSVGYEATRIIEGDTYLITYHSETMMVELWPSRDAEEGDVADLHVVGVTERHVVASDDFKEAVGYKITDPRTFASGSANEITENGMCVLSEDVSYPIDEWPEKLLLSGNIEYFVNGEDVSRVENFSIPFVRMDTDSLTYVSYAPAETQETPIVQAVIATTEEIQLEQIVPKGFIVMPRQDENFRLVSISAHIIEEEKTVEVNEDFTDAVSAAIGPVEDKSPVVIREYDLNNSIVIIPEGGGDNYIYPTFLDFQGYIASGRPIIYRTSGAGDAITYNVSPVQSLFRQAYDSMCYLILNDQSNTGSFIQKIIYRAEDQSSPFVRNRSFTFSGSEDGTVGS